MRTGLLIAVLSLAQLGPCNLFRSEPEPSPEVPTPSTPPTPQPQPLPEPTPEPEPQPEPELRPEPLPPPEEQPVKQTVHYLAPEESSFIWTYSRDTFDPPEKDPLNPTDCDYLPVGSEDVARRYYSAAIFRFDTVDILAASPIKQVQLELYLARYRGLLYPFSLTANRLAQDWWLPCPAESTVWQHAWKDQLPSMVWGKTTYYGDTVVGKWYAIDITDEYLGWSKGAFPNYGLLVESYTLFTMLGFYSSQYESDPSFRPRVVVEYKPAIPKKLRFPLDGVVDENGNIPDESISGYRFGEHWKNRYCPDSQVRLLHTGIDLRASAGTPVYAVNGGIIRFARADDKEGGYVVIEHAIGDIVFTSTYTHVTPSSIRVDDYRVKRDEVIGTVSAIKSPHLHFQVWMAGYDREMVLRGRLPEVKCKVPNSPYPQPEPQFPEKFVNPLLLAWE